MEQHKPINYSAQEKNINAEQYPPVEVQMVFQAPVERVWRAWSDPEMVKQWWGPEGFSCPEAHMDFRLSGKYSFAMADDKKGGVVWSSGEYKELIPNERIVYTDYFSDASGKPVDPKTVGMPGIWPANTFVTLEFERKGENQTSLSLKHEGIPAEMHDDCVQGWTSTLEKMRRLVQTH